MYENGKIRPVEIIPGMGEEKMMEEVNSIVIYCKNFDNCQNVPSIQQ
jgi:hypothetical protein